MGERVLLAMSGGVDSSVAASLLIQEGYEVIGLFMRTGVHEEEASCTTQLPQLPVVNARSHKKGCCSASDAADARRVADKLSLPFYAVDFSNEFGSIMDYFVEEYTSGRTPNPCVMCNNWLKFGRLYDYAQELGATKIATGHYARLGRDPHTAQLTIQRGIDRSKDQSYVLFGISREILEHLLFPVGAYEKSTIRELAHGVGLRVADKPDSQEICFVPNNNYQQFIRERLPEFDGAGEFVDTEGNFLAQHDGYDKFTVGQRRGLGVAFGSRRYVVQINPETRQVVIGSKEDLLERKLTADKVNWHIQPDSTEFRCDAQIRYLHTAAPATVQIHEDNRIALEFDEPQSAITPGQAVVLYDGERLLGGGYIRSVESSCLLK